MVITREMVQCINLHGPSLCCMQHHTPHTWWVHLTSGQKGQMVVGEKGKQLAELAPCTFAACDSSQLAATSCREHVPKVAELLDNFKLFVSNLNLWNFSFIDSLSSPKASGAPELRVRAQGSLNATAFLMHPALAATTEDCIRATNSWLTGTTGYFPDFFSTSRLMPDSTIFVFPIFTRRPFFSISVSDVCTFTAVPPWTQHWSSGRLRTAAPTDSLCGTPWIEPLTQWWRVAG